MRIADDKLASDVRATGSASVESFNLSPQYVIRGSEFVESPDVEALQKYSVVDRMARHAFIGPRIVPAGGILVSLGVLALNHWYATSQHRYYPVVLYVMPPVLFLGLGGMFNPSVFLASESLDYYPLSCRRARVILIALGFGLGVFLHGWIY